MYRKQDLAVGAPFYNAPMSSGAVYVFTGKQVTNCCVHFHTYILSQPDLSADVSLTIHALSFCLSTCELFYRRAVQNLQAALTRRGWLAVH